MTQPIPAACNVFATAQRQRSEWNASKSRPLCLVGRIPNGSYSFVLEGSGSPVSKAAKPHGKTGAEKNTYTRQKRRQAQLERATPQDQPGKHRPQIAQQHGSLRRRFAHPLTHYTPPAERTFIDHRLCISYSQKLVFYCPAKQPPANLRGHCGLVGLWLDFLIVERGGVHLGSTIDHPPTSYPSLTQQHHHHHQHHHHRHHTS